MQIVETIQFNTSLVW